MTLPPSHHFTNQDATCTAHDYLHWLTSTRACSLVCSADHCETGNAFPSQTASGLRLECAAPSDCVEMFQHIIRSVLVLLNVISWSGRDYCTSWFVFVSEKTDILTKENKNKQTNKQNKTKKKRKKKEKEKKKKKKRKKKEKKNPTSTWIVHECYMQV